MTDAVLSALRPVARLAALSAIVAVLVPLQLLVLAVSRGPASLVLPALFHRSVCAVLGLRAEVRGTVVSDAQVVFICNHLSHLDVPVLGGVLRGCFVAKEDVRDWPVLGPLARLQQTVFVSRMPRRVAEVAASLAAALAAGHNVVLFPEGTTSDGSSVLPFKSSLFAVLTEPALRHVALQPVTIELLAVDGTRIDDGGNRDGYAYYGEMRLWPHLVDFMRGSGACLRLTLHAPLPPATDLPRKSLAALAHARVSQLGMPRTADAPAASVRA